MKKFSFEYVKKNPVMFGAIVIVFGLLFWVLMGGGSRGASGGSTAVINAGPSDAQIATGAQIQMAQIQAGAQTTLAQMQLAAVAQQGADQQALAALSVEYQLAELASSERVADKTTEANLAAITAQLNTQLAMTESNNAFMVDYARQAHDAATAQVALNTMAGIEMTRINADLHKTLGEQSLKGFIASAISSVTVPRRKADEKLNAIASIAGGTAYNPNAPAGTTNSAGWDVVKSPILGLIG